MNPIFQFLHGKHYTLDTMSGTFRHQHYRDRLGLLVQNLYFEADEKGQQTEEYRKVRAELKDDWSRCLTQDIDRYVDIALELGYTD